MGAAVAPPWGWSHCRRREFTHRCSFEERAIAVAELVRRRAATAPPRESAAATVGERAAIARKLSPCSAASIGSGEHLQKKKKGKMMGSATLDLGDREWENQLVGSGPYHVTRGWVNRPLERKVTGDGRISIGY